MSVRVSFCANQVHFFCIYLLLILAFAVSRFFWLRGEEGFGVFLFFFLGGSLLFDVQITKQLAFNSHSLIVSLSPSTQQYNIVYNA